MATLSVLTLLLFRVPVILVFPSPRVHSEVSSKPLSTDEILISADTATFGHPKDRITKDGIGAIYTVRKGSVNINPIRAILYISGSRERAILVFAGTRNPIAKIVIRIYITG